MSIGVTRYIEVQIDKCERNIYYEDLYNIGHWKDNDIVFVYSENKHYRILFNDTLIQYIPIDDAVNEANIVFHASTFDILPACQLPLYNGIVYSAVVDGVKRYFEYKGRNQRFIRRETCPKKWVLVKFNTFDNITQLSTDTHCNIFLQDYIYRGELSHRGLSVDISDDIKNHISETDFGVTTVTLDEIEKIYNKSIEDLSILVKKYFDNASIEKLDNKMEILFKHFNIEYKNKNDEDLLEYFDADFEEQLSFFEVVSNEITQITTLASTYFDTYYISSNRIRITYTFNN